MQNERASRGLQSKLMVLFFLSIGKERTKGADCEICLSDYEKAENYATLQIKLTAVLIQ
jgi:hypothetical protein